MLDFQAVKDKQITFETLIDGLTNQVFDTVTTG